MRIFYKTGPYSNNLSKNLYFKIRIQGIKNEIGNFENFKFSFLVPGKRESPLVDQPIQDLRILVVNLSGGERILNT